MGDKVVEKTDQYGDADGHSCGKLHGTLVGSYQINENNQRQQQIDFREKAAQLGQFFSRNAPQPEFFGFQVDSNVDAGKIEHSRKNSL